jgi:GT2 family glycosyltransferase
MISGSVVLFRTSRDDIERIVASFSPCERRHLFLVDNSPEETDLSFLRGDAISHIEYVFIGKNIGYGSAHNIALRASVASRCNYHVVLNPDIIFEPNVLDDMTSFMDDNEDVIYALPRVQYPNGDLQYLCKLLPNPFQMMSRGFLLRIGSIKRLDDRFTLKRSGYQRILNPPCLSGCFMLFRVSAVSEHRLFFDERFFMYYEDFDLIRRCHRIGKTIYYPYATIVHKHARTAHKNFGMLMVFLLSTIKYFNKYGWLFDRERVIMNKKIETEIDRRIW